MQAALHSKATYRLGSYKVDLQLRRITRDGRAIDLNFRSFEALALLVEARGGIVERDVFFRNLWPDSEVDESSLGKCISQLRKALSEGDPEIEYVETIPKVGYRLAIPLEEIEPPPAEAGRPRRRWAAWAVASVVLAIIAVWTGWRVWERQGRAREFSRLLSDSRTLLTNGDPASAAQAIALLRRALEVESQDARAHALLAEAFHRQAQPDPPAGEATTAALEPARRSVALDPRCGECHAVLGFLLMCRAFDWSAAEQHLREGVKLAPRYSQGHGWLALLFSSTGRLEEALKEMDEASRVDPYYRMGPTIRASILYFLRRYPAAIAEADRALGSNRINRGAWEWRTRSLLMLGREEEAVRGIAEGLLPESAAELEQAVRVGGPQAGLHKAVALLSSGQVHPTLSFRRAAWKAHLGAHQAALDDVETMLRLRNFHLIYLSADPIFDSIRQHPRFCKVLSEVGLADRVEGCRSL